ncbi:MAG TPA: hypothetical protein VL096_00880, partial [Pirellulaceae bacterium]|nr:hypothetical protein [Pirellulaceae bacterium]
MTRSNDSAGPAKRSAKAWLLAALAVASSGVAVATWAIASEPMPSRVERLNWEPIANPPSGVRPASAWEEQTPTPRRSQAIFSTLGLKNQPPAQQQRLPEINLDRGQPMTPPEPTYQPGSAPQFNQQFVGRLEPTAGP